MKRRSTKLIRRAAKRQQKEIRMRESGGESRYARKRAWCNSHGVWGFEVPFPKPWA